METVERWLAWFIFRAAWTNPDHSLWDKHRDIAVACAHYANGTALSRDYRAIRGW